MTEQLHDSFTWRLKSMTYMYMTINYMKSSYMTLYLHEQHLHDIGKKPINMTKLLIYMTNVYMTNIDMMFSLNHMTLICITFHILTKYKSWLWCKIVQNIAR